VISDHGGTEQFIAGHFPVCPAIPPSCWRAKFMRLGHAAHRSGAVGSLTYA
jgi:hypothetical protein